MRPLLLSSSERVYISETAHIGSENFDREIDMVEGNYELCIDFDHVKKSIILIKTDLPLPNESEFISLDRKYIPSDYGSGIVILFSRNKPTLSEELENYITTELRNYYFGEINNFEKGWFITAEAGFPLITFYNVGRGIEGIKIDFSTDWDGN